MDEQKLKRLEAKGFAVTSVKELFGLDETDKNWIDEKLRRNAMAEVLSTYEIGDKVHCQYTNAPVQSGEDYEVGRIVEIADSKTGELIAAYEVIATDDTDIWGVIVEVAK